MTDKADIDPARRALGMRLALARQSKQFTQLDIATRFSLNKATVSAWETGRGTPDALTLRDLAKLYDVSADSLLWEDSLSAEAMKFAAAFDRLKEAQKRTLNAICKAYIQQSATEDRAHEATPEAVAPPMNMGEGPGARESTVKELLQMDTVDNESKYIEFTLPNTSRSRNSDEPSSNPESESSERGKHAESASKTRRSRRT